MRFRRSDLLAGVVSLSARAPESAKPHGIHDNEHDEHRDVLSAVPSLTEDDLAYPAERDGHLPSSYLPSHYGIGADAANPEAVAAVLPLLAAGWRCRPASLSRPSM